MKPKLSLKGRGLQLLSQREHSRSELRRKLLRHARAEAAERLAASRAAELAEDDASLHHEPAHGVDRREGNLQSGLQGHSGSGVGARPEAVLPRRQNAGRQFASDSFFSHAPGESEETDSDLLSRLGVKRASSLSEPGQPGRPALNPAVNNVASAPASRFFASLAPSAPGLPLQSVSRSGPAPAPAPAPVTRRRSERLSATRAASADEAPDSRCDDRVGSAPELTPEAAVDAVLDWLQAHRYLSEERFVESRVHARAARYGNLRIRQELAQHGVALGAEEAQALKDTELARAREVWRRKFGAVAVDAAGRAKQMRFLGGRGFSPEVIRRVVQGSEDD